MNVEEIVGVVKQVILRHARPERIWLYGSRANGEATAVSDVDLAFEDKDFHDIWRIKEELDALPTLLKIDIKNLADTEERFRQRVITTGRVIYSASKKLRFEDGMHNFRHAFGRFNEAVERRDLIEREGFGDIFLDLAVKRFEFTYEMSWKAIKRCLDYLGIEAKYPRACFKEAFAIGLIKDEGIWLEMIDQRNRTSHVYNQDEVKGILTRLEVYRDSFGELLLNLEQKLVD